MPKSIMLATDLGPRCDRALDRAAALAREWQAHLSIVHVLEYETSVADAPSWRRADEPVRIAERRIRRDLVAANELMLKIVVERGAAGSVLADFAARQRPDLIVTGCAREESLGRSLLGSSVDALTRRQCAPLLVVKQRPRHPYRNIVVATDYSAGARQAGELALTWWPQASVALFHAYTVAFEGLLHNKAPYVEQARLTAVEECRRFAAEAGAERYATLLCEHGEPASLLMDLVQHRDVDLVVIGASGRSAFVGAVLGSVARRVLDRVPSDVLVVPPAIAAQ